MVRMPITMENKEQGEIRRREAVRYGKWKKVGRDLEDSCSAEEDGRDCESCVFRNSDKWAISPGYFVFEVNSNHHCLCVFISSHTQNEDEYKQLGTFPTTVSIK